MLIIVKLKKKRKKKDSWPDETEGLLFARRNISFTSLTIDRLNITRYAISIQN